MKLMAVPDLVERKMWSQEEDNILRQIVTTRRAEKWSAISKILEEEYGVTGRSAKQCRERWCNTLDPNIRNDSWTDEQQERLFQLHNQYGNRWAKISEMLTGRTDNAIKNHFYCTLRKALRRVNRYICEHKHKLKIREIKTSILSKAIAVAEEKFESKLVVPEGLVEACCSIKNRLLRFAKVGELTPTLEAGLRQLIADIGDFNRSYKKKKTKKKKRDEPKQSGKVKEEEQKSSEEEEDEGSDNVNYAGPYQQEEPAISNVAVASKSPSVLEVQTLKPSVPFSGSPIIASPLLYYKDLASPLFFRKDLMSPHLFRRDAANDYTVNHSQPNQIVLSKSIEFEMEEFLKSSNNNNIFTGKDSPTFVPLSPPRFSDDVLSAPGSPLLHNLFDKVENPYSSLIEESASTKMRPTIVLKELPRIAKRESLGSQVKE